MKIFIVRHGTAEPISDRYNEEDRPLTEQGRDEAQTAGSFLQNVAPDCQIVVASPYTRAHQTAVQIARSLGCKVRISNNLVPNGRIENVLDEVLALKDSTALKDDATSLCLVSHQPLVSHLLATLCEANEFTFDFRPAAVAEVDVEFNSDVSTLFKGQLCSLVQARHMRPL